MKPLPDAVHEHFYAESLRILGLDDLSPSERLSRIQGLNEDEVAKISVFPSRPIVDGDICLEMPTVKAVADGIPTTLHRGWCQDLFIGDCQFDVSISIPLASNKLLTMELGIHYGRCLGSQKIGH